MKIVVDSGCDFTEDMRNKNGINIEKVPLTLQLKDNQYIDNESLNVNGYINDMVSGSSSPKTAAPSPQLYLESFRGSESIFGVTLSSKLSASYSNAMLAKSMYQSEIGNKFIHIFDSLSATVGETIIALKINEFIKKNLEETEIVEKVNSFIDGMKTYFILERYDNLVKNGRINPYIAKIASLINIKPICTAKEGEMLLLEKVRGTQKALIRLADMIASQKLDFENRTLGITHVRCIDKALFFKDEIAKRVPFRDIIIAEAGGICSTYADDGGFVVAY